MDSITSEKAEAMVQCSFCEHCSNCVLTGEHKRVEQMDIDESYRYDRRALKTMDYVRGEFYYLDRAVSTLVSERETRETTCEEIEQRIRSLTLALQMMSLTLDTAPSESNEGDTNE